METAMATSAQERLTSFFTFLADTPTSPSTLSESPSEGTTDAHPLPPLNTTTQSPLSWNESDTEMTITSTAASQVFLPWDNPYNVISLQTFLSFEKVMICYVSLGLFLVGAPTNVINCVVFYRQGLRDRMNMCLFCLALVDLLFVTFFYLISSNCMVGYFYPEVKQWWKYFARKYFTGIYRGFLYSSGCLTALISLERCVCVVLPLKAASLIHTRTMAVLIAVIVSAIHLAALLYPLQLDIGSCTDPETGRTTLFLSSTQFYTRHKLLYLVVEVTMLMVVVPFATFIIVVISTVVTVLELKLRLQWRQLSSSFNHNAAKRQQVKLVKMLVVVSCLYIVTAAPNVALGLARSLVPEFRHTRRYANIFLASHLLYLMLAMFNSSINFFVYVARSSRFRTQLVIMLGCWARSSLNEGSAASTEGVATKHDPGHQVSRVSRFRTRLAAMLGSREATLVMSSAPSEAGVSVDHGCLASGKD